MSLPEKIQACSWALFDDRCPSRAQRKLDFSSRGELVTQPMCEYTADHQSITYGREIALYGDRFQQSGLTFSFKNDNALPADAQIEAEGDLCGLISRERCASRATLDSPMIANKFSGQSCTPILTHTAAGCDRFDKLYTKCEIFATPNIWLKLAEKYAKSSAYAQKNHFSTQRLRVPIFVLKLILTRERRAISTVIKEGK